PAFGGVKLGRVGIMSRDHRARVAGEFFGLFARKGRWGGEDEGVAAELRGGFERGEMRGGGILNRQPAVKQLVGLEVGTARDRVRVVVLGEEASGAQNRDTDAMFAMDELTGLF